MLQKMVPTPDELKALQRATIWHSTNECQVYGIQESDKQMTKKKLKRKVDASGSTGSDLKNFISCDNLATLNDTSFHAERFRIRMSKFLYKNCHA
jgi:hypothetical protein